MLVDVIAMFVPTEAVAKVAEGFSVTSSVPSLPFKVPVMVAATVPSYALLDAVTGLIVKFAAVIVPPLVPEVLLPSNQTSEIHP